MKKKIFYVRHGETQANVARIVAGGEYESSLTENGKRQAQEAGEILKNKKIELIVSSPMERTTETAKIIAKGIGFDPGKIIFDEAFVEVFNGFYSGKSYDLRNEHIKNGKLIDDIEHPDKVKKRVSDGLKRLKRYSASNIVLVSHGATGRMIRALTENVPHHDFMSHKPFENTEIYEFELE